VNVVSHLLTFSDGAEVDVPNLPPRVVKEGEKHRAQPAYPGFRTAKERVLSKFEREYLATLLERCEGNLSRAARESGLHRKSIERLARKYRLDARTLRARRGAAKR
jgi:DNA-binding NtrC family response regulator